MKILYVLIISILFFVSCETSNIDDAIVTQEDSIPSTEPVQIIEDDQKDASSPLNTETITEESIENVLDSNIVVNDNLDEEVVFESIYDETEPVLIDESDVVLLDDIETVLGNVEEVDEIVLVDVLDDEIPQVETIETIDETDLQVALNDTEDTVTEELIEELQSDTILDNEVIALAENQVEPELPIVLDENTILDDSQSIFDTETIELPIEVVSEDSEVDPNLSTIPILSTDTVTDILTVDNGSSADTVQSALEVLEEESDAVENIIQDFVSSQDSSETIGQTQEPSIVENNVEVEATVDTNEAFQTQEVDTLIETLPNVQDTIVIDESGNMLTNDSQRNEESLPNSSAPDVIVLDSEIIETPIEIKTEIEPSQNLELFEEDYVDILLSGQGWIYLGEVKESNPVVVEFYARYIDGTDTIFNFYAENDGVTVLHFYKQDILGNTYLDEYIQVNVKPLRKTQQLRPTTTNKTEELFGISAEPEVSLIGGQSETLQFGDYTEESGAFVPENILDDAQLAYDEGRYADSIALLDEYTSLGVSQVDRALYLYGKNYESSSDIRNIRMSVSAYEKLIESFPDSEHWEDAEKRVIYLERFYLNIR